MTILDDEPELQESYGLTQQECSDFRTMLSRRGKSLEIEIPERMLPAVRGEMENMSDIVWSNVSSEGVKAIGYASAIDRQLLKLP